MNQRTKMKKVQQAKKRRKHWWERDWTKASKRDAAISLWYKDIGANKPKDGWALEGSWDTTEDRKLWEAQRRK